jgi:hypothetical protein
LMALTPGDSARIDVGLTGLGAGEQLVSLTGSVLFPAALLGTPLSISPGPIIPYVSDFLDAPFAGRADGTLIPAFDPANPDPTHWISQNGVFYSFRVQAQAAGSGVFTLDPEALAAQQYDPQAPPLPMLRDVTAGAALPFDISTIAVIPAPPALGLALLGWAIIRRKFGRTIG